MAKRKYITVAGKPVCTKKIALSRIPDSRAFVSFSHKRLSTVRAALKLLGAHTLSHQPDNRLFLRKNHRNLLLLSQINKKRWALSYEALVLLGVHDDG